jgi:fatty-acid desaturase
MRGPLCLFFWQILAHLGLATMLLHGNFGQWLVLLVVYFFTGCIGMTMTYHRLIAHRSWCPPKVIEHAGALVATLGLTGSAISWVAIHRKHHKFADTEKDPHSPRFKGFIYCQWLSMFEVVELRYVTDLIKDPFYRFQHKYYFIICLAYSLGLFILLEPFAVVYAFLAPACVLWNAGSSIITISHLFGSKEHNIKSNAGNIWILGLLVWGEGWHNNHHANPSDPYFFRKFLAGRYGRVLYLGF